MLERMVEKMIKKCEGHSRIRRTAMRRRLACALTVCMVFTLTPVNTLAVQGSVGNGTYAAGLCEHHPKHTAECGFAEAEEGHACEHVHGPDCYTDEPACGHNEGERKTASDSNAVHHHTQDCFKRNCPHERGEHDDYCGFLKAVKGHDCEYVCEVCNPGSDDETGTCITEFNELDGAVREQTVPAGTAKSTLSLPATLKASGYKVNDAAGSQGAHSLLVKGVTWGSDPVYDGEAPDTYTFTAILPDGYETAEGVNLPQITVTVEKTADVDEEAVAQVEALIAALPTAEEYSALAKDYPDHEDADYDEEYADWLEELNEQKQAIHEAVSAYNALNEAEKERITPKLETKLSDLIAVMRTGMLRSGGPNDTNNDNYHDGDVAAFNKIIADHGLKSKINGEVVLLKENKPDSWGAPPPKGAGIIVKWSKDSPKRITKLDLSFQELAGNLDVSALTELTELNCSYNNLNELTNLGSLTKLTSLVCNSNQLTELTGLGSLTKLTILSCDSNQLTELTGLGSLTSLTDLYCGDNQLKTLTGLGSLMALTDLSCDVNQLENLTELSSLANLKNIKCNNNKLTTLDLSTLSSLKSLDCKNNPIATLKLPDSNALIVGNAENGTAMLTDYDHVIKSVELTASPSDGYTFKKWTISGGSTTESTDNPVMFTLDGEITITPVYTSALLLTGTVTVSGTPKYGETLTATYADGNNTGDLSYQWKRGTNEIPGATSAAYTIVQDDIGQILTCVVTSSVQAGSVSGSTSSVIAKGDDSNLSGSGGSTSGSGGSSGGSGGSSGGSGGSSGGSSGSGSSSGSSSGSHSSSTTTTTSGGTTQTEDGGAIITSTTTSSTGTTVNTRVKKDTAGNVTGAQAEVTAGKAAVSTKDGKSNVEIKVDANAVTEAASAAGTALDITIKLPAEAIKDQINAAENRSVGVELTIPTAVAGSAQTPVTGITLEKEVIEAAKAAGKDLTVTIKDEHGTVSSQWFIDGEDLKNSALPVTDMNLTVHTVPVKTLSGGKEPIKAAAAETTEQPAEEVPGLAIAFGHSGTLPATFRVRIPPRNDAGIQPGDTVYLYYYNPVTGKLESMPDNQYAVEGDGYVIIHLSHSSDYVLLPQRQGKMSLPQTEAAGFPVGTVNHTVKKGDTIYLLAKAYGCTVDEILALNHVSDVYDLTIGQELLIPVR